MASPPCPLHVCFVCVFSNYVRIPDTARYAAGAQHAKQAHKGRLLSAVSPAGIAGYAACRCVVVAHPSKTMIEKKIKNFEVKKKFKPQQMLRMLGC